MNTFPGWLTDQLERAKEILPFGKGGPPAYFHIKTGLLITTTYNPDGQQAEICAPLYKEFCETGWQSYLEPDSYQGAYEPNWRLREIALRRLQFASFWKNTHPSELHRAIAVAGLVELRRMGWDIDVTDLENQSATDIASLVNLCRSIKSLDRKFELSYFLTLSNYLRSLDYLIHQQDHGLQMLKYNYCYQEDTVDWARKLMYQPIVPTDYHADLCSLVEQYDLMVDFNKIQNRELLAALSLNFLRKS